MTWYTGDPVFDTVLAVGLAFAAVTLLGSIFVPAPYGRFAQGSGVNLHPKLGWWLMEIPATVVFLFFFLQSSPEAWTTTTLVLAGLWLLHYGNRGWFFPLAIRAAPGARSSFSLMVMAMGMFVTAIHGYLHAMWFTEYGSHLTPQWLTDPRFLIGLAIYALGLFLILTSESVMRHLRPPNPPADAPRYRIPYGYGFRWVSNPQYLGEIIAWTGFAILTWGLPGVMILLISASNLVPRALATHRWYREQFPDYPRERRALIPYVL
ncbi:3-oxo-5-alpha-steroid 4-dehydrogenase [Algiphilus sp.]|uniref:3-oxo-5-alpha-steroid 4-dehydrogenase n=1 Tax=Algiphilus sp. TaxID=1872431 RepID=UPI003B51DD81